MPHFTRFLRPALVLAVASISLAPGASAQTLQRQEHVILKGDQLFIDYAYKKKKPETFKKKDKKTPVSEDVSGAVCLADRTCYAVSDEGRHVQAFDWAFEDDKTKDDQNGAIVFNIGETLFLAKPHKNEFDFEALAAWENTLFVMGSHSFGRNSCRRDANRAVVFFGVPDRSALGTETATRMEGVSLTQSMRSFPELSSHVEQPLQHKGLNLEGMAVLGARIYFGLRAPYQEDALHASYVVSYAVQDLLAGRAIDPQLHRVGLSAASGAGIRAMERYGEDILILSGPSGVAGGKRALCRDDSAHRDHSFVLHRWSPQDNTLEPILEIVPPEKGWKAEGLLAVPKGMPSRAHISVVVLFDGGRSGHPVRYEIEMPEVGK